MFVGHLYIFFGEMCSQVLSSFILVDSVLVQF